MEADFKGRSELVSELYWCGREYEEYPEKYPQSKAMYERIIAEFPNSVEANQAYLDIPRLEILELIQQADVNAAETAIDAFIVDYNSQPHTSACLRRIATEYYTTATGLKAERRNEEAMQYFARARGVWQRIIDKMPVRAEETDTAYFFAACSLREMGQWEDVIKYFQVVLDDWPDYEHADVAQAAIGWSYEALVYTGKLTKEQGTPLIEQAYSAVLEKYADSQFADDAAFKLAGLNEQRGDIAGAIAFYKEFLAITDANDWRVSTSKERVAALEGGSR